MKRPSDSPRRRRVLIAGTLAVAAFSVSAVLFVILPALRPAVPGCAGQGPMGKVAVNVGIACVLVPWSGNFTCDITSIDWLDGVVGEGRPDDQMSTATVRLYDGDRDAPVIGLWPAPVKLASGGSVLIQNATLPVSQESSIVDNGDGRFGVDDEIRVNSTGESLKGIQLWLKGPCIGGGATLS